MGKTIGMISACAHRLYLYRPELLGVCDHVTYMTYQPVGLARSGTGTHLERLVYGYSFF